MRLCQPSMKIWLVMCFACHNYITVDTFWEWLLPLLACISSWIHIRISSCASFICMHMCSWLSGSLPYMCSADSAHWPAISIPSVVIIAPLTHTDIYLLLLSSMVLVFICSLYVPTHCLMPLHASDVVSHMLLIHWCGSICHLCGFSHASHACRLSDVFPYSHVSDSICIPIYGTVYFLFYPDYTYTSIYTYQCSLPDAIYIGISYMAVFFSSMLIYTSMLLCALIFVYSLAMPLFCSNFINDILCMHIFVACSLFAHHLGKLCLTYIIYA